MQQESLKNLDRGPHCGANTRNSSIRNSSNFRAQVALFLKGASAIGSAVLPSGAATDTRKQMSTHRMSNVPLQFCIFVHHVQESRLGLIPRSLYQVQLENGPHMCAFEGSGSLVRPCWMSFRILFRITGVTPSLNHSNTIILVSKIPQSLSASSQSNMFRSSCFTLAFVLLTTSCWASIVMPVPRMFLQLPDSGGHKGELLRSGRSAPRCHHSLLNQRPCWLHYLSGGFSWRQPHRPLLRSFYSSQIARSQLFELFRKIDEDFGGSIS